MADKYDDSKIVRCTVCGCWTYGREQCTLHRGA